jgi:ribonuclease III
MSDRLLGALQDRLGWRFVQPELLLRALTHRSASADHNERLEFLGDAVLQAAVSALLYQRFPDHDEGGLTRIRAHLVREDSLARIARDLGLSAVVRLSEGEARGGGAIRPSILADALEALIGAAYLDAGYAVAQNVVHGLFTDVVASASVEDWRKDAKTALQEWLQARKHPVPEYRITATHGQAHAQTFEVECVVDVLGKSTLGEGKSRRAAEQAAATKMLALLESSS